MSAPRNNEEARELFMHKARTANAGGIGKRRTLTQFAAEQEEIGNLPTGGDDETGDGLTTRRPANVTAMPQRKLPRPEPLPEEINVSQESVRTRLNLTMKDGTTRTFVVYDVPFFRADEFVFFERQIGELRKGFPDCKTIGDVKKLRDEIADLITEEVKIIMPEMTVEILRELGARQYKTVSDLVSRIGGEVVGMYDLSEPKPGESDPKSDAAESSEPDTMYPQSDR